MRANVKARHTRSRPVRVLRLILLVMLGMHCYQMFRMRQRAQRAAWGKVTRYDLTVPGSAVIAVHVSKTGKSLLQLNFECSLCSVH
jgi:hypothetical protein